MKRLLVSLFVIASMVLAAPTLAGGQLGTLSVGPITYDSSLSPNGYVGRLYGCGYNLGGNYHLVIWDEAGKRIFESWISGNLIQNTSSGRGCIVGLNWSNDGIEGAGFRIYNEITSDGTAEGIYSAAMIKMSKVFREMDFASPVIYFSAP